MEYAFSLSRQEGDIALKYVADMAEAAVPVKE
jgi:hypothetical protein